MKRLIHGLTRSHSWLPMERFTETWIEGWRFWSELFVCDCGASKWDVSRRAIEEGLRRG